MSFLAWFSCLWIICMFWLLHVQYIQCMYVCAVHVTPLLFSIHLICVICGSLKLRNLFCFHSSSFFNIFMYLNRISCTYAYIYTVKSCQSCRNIKSVSFNPSVVVGHCSLLIGPKSVASGWQPQAISVLAYQWELLFTVYLLYLYLDCC